MVMMEQRYVRAVGSSNLRNDAWHHDTEVLMAMAMTSTFAGLLARVKLGNDASSLRKLKDQWTWIVSTKAVRHNWPVHVKIDKVAYLALVRWLNDICPACTGRKNETVFNTPSLADEKCRLCDGEGKTELRCHPALRDYVVDMVEELERSYAIALARARKKHGQDDGNLKNHIPAQKGI